jgi:hypothetical protein
MVLLALPHEALPPTANLGLLNPRLELERTPFVVPTTVLPWPRRAGCPGRRGHLLGIAAPTATSSWRRGPAPCPTPAVGAPAGGGCGRARDADAEDVARTRLAEQTLGRSTGHCSPTPWPPCSRAGRTTSYGEPWSAGRRRGGPRGTRGCTVGARHRGGAATGRVRHRRRRTGTAPAAYGVQRVFTRERRVSSRRSPPRVSTYIRNGQRSGSRPTPRPRFTAALPRPPGSSSTGACTRCASRAPYGTPRRLAVGGVDQRRGRRPSGFSGRTLSTCHCPTPPSRPCATPWTRTWTSWCGSVGAHRRPRVERGSSRPDRHRRRSSGRG